MFESPYLLFALMCMLAGVVLRAVVRDIRRKLDIRATDRKEAGRKRIRTLLAEISEMRRGDREPTIDAEASHWNDLRGSMRTHGFTPRDFGTSWACILDTLRVIDANRRAGLQPIVRKAGIVARPSPTARGNPTGIGRRKRVSEDSPTVQARQLQMIGNGGASRDGAEHDLRRRTESRQPTLVMHGMRIERTSSPG